jgi:hypothetical protein
VARYLGIVGGSNIVARQARLYTEAAKRLRENEQRRPDPQYVKRCGHCGAPRHLTPTCPQLRPDRNVDDGD